MNRQQIIIVGAGLTGLFIANALKNNNIPLILIEKNDLNHIKTKTSDGRASAISFNNAQTLDHFGLWQLFAHNYCPIEQIRITDQHSPMFLHFDNQLVDSNPLGFMIENQTMLSKLIQSLQESPLVTIYDNCIVEEITENSQKVAIKISTNDVIEGQILIAADGKFSAIRELANIKSYQFHYSQTAMVFNVKHQLNHHNIAIESFFPSGPFAILPLKGGQSSAVVWTEKNELADIYIKLPEEEFNYHLTQRFTDYLGELKVISKIFTYPLSVKFSHQYFNNRICLVGDSAHTIHPIAGQGFNQTIRDIKELVALLKDYYELGLDLGSTTLLKQYQQTRRLDNYAMLAITDSLNRLFSNNVFPLRNIRRLGLTAINKIPKLQKFFMNYAMGYR